MAKGAMSGPSRGINPAGAPAEFLKEEAYRGRLASGARVMPYEHFQQMDNGAHTTAGGSLDVLYNPTSMPMHTSDVRGEDINGGLF